MVTKTKTVIWSLALVVAPTLLTTAVQQYMAGSTLTAAIALVLALLAAIGFVISFTTEFAFEDDIKGYVDALVDEKTADADAQRLVEATARKLEEEGVTAEDLKDIGPDQ